MISFNPSLNKSKWDYHETKFSPDMKANSFLIGTDYVTLLVCFFNSVQLEGQVSVCVCGHSSACVRVCVTVCMYEGVYACMVDSILQKKN